MATAEQRSDFFAHVRRLQSTVGRLEETEVRKVFSELRDARGEIENRLAFELGRAPAEAFGPAQATRIRGQIDRVVRDLWNRYDRSLNETDRRLMEEAVKSSVRGIEATGGDVAGAPTLSPTLVETSARFKAMLIERRSGIQGVADTQVNKLSGIVSRGIITGQSPRQISLDMARSGWLSPLKRADGTIIGVGARADTIARTEVNRVFNITSSALDEQLQKTAPKLVLMKIWVDAGDARVRDSHQVAAERYSIDGDDPGPIPIDEDFMIGGHPAAFPQDPRLPAGESVNCRCRKVSFSAAFKKAA